MSLRIGMKKFPFFTLVLELKTGLQTHFSCVETWFLSEFHFYTFCGIRIVLVSREYSSMHDKNVVRNRSTVDSRYFWSSCHGHRIFSFEDDDEDEVFWERRPYHRDDFYRRFPVGVGFGIPDIAACNATLIFLSCNKLYISNDYIFVEYAQARAAIGHFIA